MKRLIEKGGIVFFPKVCLTVKMNDSHLFFHSLCCRITYLTASRRQLFSSVRIGKKHVTL